MGFSGDSSSKAKAIRILALLDSSSKAKAIRVLAPVDSSSKAKAIRVLAPVDSSSVANEAEFSELAKRGFRTPGLGQVQDLAWGHRAGTFLGALGLGKTSGLRDLAWDFALTSGFQGLTSSGLGLGLQGFRTWQVEDLAWGFRAGAF